MRRTVVLTALAVILVGATFLLRSRGPQCASQRPSPTTSVAAAVTPAAAAEADATTIALRAIRSTGDIARAGFITRNDLIGSIATARFAPTLKAVAGVQLTQFTTAIGAAGVPAAEVVWEELPLTSHIADRTGGRARVAVWSVLIVGVPGHGAGRQVWRTSMIDLVHDTVGWKVDGWTAVPGPTPSLVATEAISDLPSVATVLGWVPVGEVAG